MIDCFNYKQFPPIVIPENEKTRKKWDLEENRHFVSGNVNDRVYKALRKNKPTDQKIFDYLYCLHQYIYLLKRLMLENPQVCQECRCETTVFIITPHEVQEICQNTTYEGINKPKFLVQSPEDGLLFKRDNHVRAGLRLVMLSLRTPSGNFRSWSKVKKLLLHELAHTMCNHCTYREDENHEEDFDKCEAFLKKLSNYQKCKEYENGLKKIIGLS